MRHDGRVKPSHSIAALELFNDVLAHVDEDLGSTEFYSRLAEAVCRVAQMQRAVIFRYDDARRRVHAAGAHGVSLARFTSGEVTVESAPVARQALTEDRVIEVLAEDGHDISEDFAELVGQHPLVYVPIVAAGRWIGVILAEPAPGASPIDDPRKDLLWMLGKTLGLASTSRIATFHGERARELEERINFARRIHESVVQRLFGVSLVLGSEGALSEEVRRRCAAEMQAALTDLRDALARPLAPPSLDTGATLREELARLGRHYKELPLELDWQRGVEVPEDVESLAQSVLAEALRNADKHADPTSVRVRVGSIDGTFLLEVRNDGAKPGPRSSRGTGMGLRLAAAEALGRGALVEFGPEGADSSEWRVRLVVPTGEDAAE